MKTALVFPGYMSQYVGMAKELYDEYRVVQELFEEASSCSNINFVKLCFASSDAELARLDHAYMSLFLVGVSVCALLKEIGITPDIVTGYNNGEITALCAAGCFSLPDGLYLLQKFCSFYEESLNTMDAAVMRITGMTAQELQRMCDSIRTQNQDIHIAFYDTEKEHIVTGSRDAISQLYAALETNVDVKVEYLVPEIGLHSDAMIPVIDQCRIYLEKVDFKDVTIPVISGIDGRILTAGAEIKEHFTNHFMSPLHFGAVLGALQPYERIIVSAPSKLLSEVIKNYYPEKNIIVIEKKSDIDALK